MLGLKFNNFNKRVSVHFLETIFKQQSVYKFGMEENDCVANLDFVYTYIHILMIYGKKYMWDSLKGLAYIVTVDPSIKVNSLIE